jgi:hypothetical protein
METDVERWWNDRGRRTEVMGEKHYIAWVVGEWMGMEHWWNVFSVYNDHIGLGKGSIPDGAIGIFH